MRRPSPASDCRWGEGNLSVLAYDNPLTMKGLTLAGRINYFASIASWTMGPARLFLYLTPLIMLLTGVAPVSDMSIAYFTVVGCYLLTVWSAVKIASNGCGQLLGIELAMMASFHLQLQASWRAIFRRKRQKFVVTAKNSASHKEFSGSASHVAANNAGGGLRRCGHLGGLPVGVRPFTRHRRRADRKRIGRATILGLH